MTTVKRMWVNQPSSLQTHHALHGQRVLAVISDADPKTARIYFLDGNVVNQEMSTLALSEGWPERRHRRPTPAFPGDCMDP